MSETGDSQLKQRYEALAVVLSRLMQPSLGDELANSLLLAQMKVQLGLALLAAYEASGTEKVLQVSLSKEASLPWIVEKLQQELVPVAEEFYLTLSFVKAPPCQMRLVEGKVKFGTDYRPASLTLTANSVKSFVLAFLEMLVDLLEEELHEAPVD